MMRLFWMPLCLFGCPCLFGQAGAADTALVARAKSYAATLFDTSLASSQHLYTGTEYMRRSTRAVGTAFWEDQDFQNGDLWYKQQFYPQTPLLYDLEKGQLVIRDAQQALLIALQNEAVDSFRLGQHLFVNLRDTSSGAASGFYEKLVDGPVQLYARRSKYYKLSARADEAALPYYTEEDSYFIRREELLTAITSEQALLATLGDQKDALRSHLREKRLKFKKNKEAVLKEAVLFYNQKKAGT